MTTIIKEYRAKQHWGNPLWGFIHSIILENNANPEKLENIKNVLKNIEHCIPCVKCVIKYTPHLAKLVDINNFTDLFNWSVDVHNNINVTFNKSQWTYKMALEEYNNTSSNYYLWSFIHTFTIIDFEENQRHNDMMKTYLVNIPNCILDTNIKNIYTTELTKLDGLDMTKPLVLFHWSIDTHNNINTMNNKSEWNYENALDRWANISGTYCTSTG